MTLSVLLFLVAPFVCHAHIVLKHPAPRRDSPNSLKAYPCGSGGQYNDFAAPSTQLAPGTQAFSFRETTVHAGSPFRLALTVSSSDDTYDQYVLLDHIQHCDSASFADNGGQGSFYEVTVDVPNVLCDGNATRCAVQLIQVMSDKFPQDSQCANPGGFASNCGNPFWSYFSCANVLINGTLSVASVAPSYTTCGVGNYTHRRSYLKGEAGACLAEMRGQERWLVPDPSECNRSTSRGTSWVTVAPSVAPSSNGASGRFSDTSSLLVRVIAVLLLLLLPLTVGDLF